MATRRRFLAWSGVSAAALAVSGRSASGLSLETAEEPVAAEYWAARAACKAQSADHAQALADLEASLDGLPISDEERRRRIAQATCPICGCSLGG